MGAGPVKLTEQLLGDGASLFLRNLQWLHEKNSWKETIAHNALTIREP